PPAGRRLPGPGAKAGRGGGVEGVFAPRPQRRRSQEGRRRYRRQSINYGGAFVARGAGTPCGRARGLVGPPGGALTVGGRGRTGGTARLRLALRLGRPPHTPRASWTSFPSIHEALAPTCQAPRRGARLV